MKITKFTLIVALLISGSIFTSCRNHQRKIAGNYDYATECLGVEMDGSQTLRSWGNGRNRSDAVEQAKKNAVRDVLFNGIRAGRSECEARPLISEVNAQRKYEDYFNKFFADGGEYKKFISAKDGSDWHIELIRTRGKAGSQATYRVVVRVLRADLKAKMIEDNIIK